MSNTVTIGFSIVPPAIADFRWVWDSNPWDPLMLYFLLPPPRQTLPLISLQSTKPLDSLSGFNTSANRSKRFCRNPMLSTRSTMINIGYHTSFRLAKKSSYICRRSVSLGPIKSFSHFVMGLTLSPRLWVAILLISTLHPSLVCIQYSMWTSFIHIFHDRGGYWWPPTYSNWLLVSIFIQHVFLYYFIIVSSTLLGLSEASHILQVDMGGLSPNPTGLFCMFSCQHILLYFQGCFGALNIVFLTRHSQTID
jgi:hypothetical protein